MLMVKADAYGHGLRAVSKATEDLVDAFGVATVDEGIKLRNYGIKKDIFVLICKPNELKSAANNGLIISLSEREQLARIIELKNAGQQIRLHIALNSGMNRLGFGESELPEIIEILKSENIPIEGAYSHLRVRSNAQIAAFNRMGSLIKEQYPEAILHLASSHSLDVKTLRYDMVRLGIRAYDGAMRVVSEVIAARRVKAGEFVSYGRFKLENDTNTAVVFGGYADGVSREFPSDVYIRGKACKVLGRVCMDMFIVDCGDFLPEIGEKAVICDSASMNDVSKQRRSIPYTVMTGFRGRIKRIYKRKR